MSVDLLWSIAAWVTLVQIVLLPMAILYVCHAIWQIVREDTE